MPTERKKMAAYKKEIEMASKVFAMRRRAENLDSGKLEPGCDVARFLCSDELSLRSLALVGPNEFGGLGKRRCNPPCNVR